MVVISATLSSCELVDTCPDFILHYPDGNDIIVDSKVVLTAMYDYYSADDEVVKAEAMARNLAAMKEQVRRLSKKDYSRYLKPGHRMLDFVIMFVPVYSALRLAYEADRNLWQEAYDLIRSRWHPMYSHRRELSLRMY